MQIRLEDRLVNKLLSLPESGMGYQRVDVRFANGQELQDVVVFNAEELEVPDDIASLPIADVRLHQNHSSGKPKLQRLNAQKPAKRAKRPATGRTVVPDRALAVVVGDTPMPRTEVTKKLWQYIKRHGLQDPKNQRVIKTDRALRKLANGRTSVRRDELSRLLDKHVKAAEKFRLRSAARRA